MAVPFLAGLTASARAAYPIIRRGVSEGLSGNAIQRVLTAAGMGVRRTVLLEIVRRERGIVRQISQLKFVPRNRIPNPARLPQALTRIRRRFSFVVRVTGRLIDTGEAILQNITISTDTVLSRAELERRAMDTIEAEQTRYGIEIESALLTSGLQAGVAGTL